MERPPLLASLWWVPLNLMHGVFNRRTKHARVQEARLALLFAIGKACKRQQIP